MVYLEGWLVIFGPIFDPNITKLSIYYPRLGYIVIVGLKNITIKLTNSDLWSLFFFKYFCRSKCPDITRKKSFHFHCPNSENIAFSFQYFSRRNPHFQPSLSRQLIPKTGFWRPPGVKFINQHNFDPPIQIFLTKNAISRAKLRSTL